MTDVKRIAQDWIDEFSVEPYVLRERGMDAWFELADLIQEKPLEALSVFEAIAAANPINWTFEGLAVGPLRTFLMVHGAHYDAELAAMRQRSSDFDEMYLMAVEGM